MDKLVSPYGYGSPIDSEVLGAGKCRNDAIMYSYNASSRTLIDTMDNKFEDRFRQL